jgi:putative phage-type endonuclease
MTTATEQRRQRAITSATVSVLKDREAWRQARKQAIGASDAAGIWGASGYSSPYSVWWSKVGPLEADEPDIIQRVGHAMEPFIAELFTEATGIETHDPGDFTIYTNSEVQCMACTPDRLTADGMAVVELKTAGFAVADEWKTRIPVGYQTQLQHQMICCGVEKAYIAVLINGTSFKWHEMDLYESFRRRHTAKCLAFWKEYVETQTAPPADYSKATSQALLHQWQDSRDRIVDLPDELNGLGERYEKLGRLSAAVERHKEEIKNRVKAVMGDAQIGRLADGTGFSWKGSGGRRTFTRKAKVFDGNE